LYPSDRRESFARGALASHSRRQLVDVEQEFTYDGGTGGAGAVGELHNDKS